MVSFCGFQKNLRFTYFLRIILLPSFICRAAMVSEILEFNQKKMMKNSEKGHYIFILQPLPIVENKQTQLLTVCLQQ